MLIAMMALTGERITELIEIVSVALVLGYYLAFREECKKAATVVLDAVIVAIRFAQMIYIHLFVRVSSRAKCPSCGSRRKHPIAFHDAYNKVMHRCEECRAIWASDPVVAHEEWKVEGAIDAEEIAQVKSIAELAKQGHAVSREPVIVRFPSRPKKGDDAVRSGSDRS